MADYFLVDHLDVNRLLREWRWLCPQPLELVARSAFGDLFLGDEAGKIFKLDIAVGQMNEIAVSETEFRHLAQTKEKRQDRKSTRLNSSHVSISYAVFCLKKKKKIKKKRQTSHSKQ